jgi:hypothetical protein
MSKKASSVQSVLSLASSACGASCVGNFVDFLNKTKGTDTVTTDNVVEMFMDHLNHLDDGKSKKSKSKSKGKFSITQEKLDNMTDLLWSSTKVSPKLVLTELYNWSGDTTSHRDASSASAEDIRDHLAFDGGALMTATHRSLAQLGEEYSKNYDTAKGPVLEIIEDELMWCGRVLNKKLASGNKKRCATCWICNGPIYVFEFVEKGKKKPPIYRKCGEDEHVVPPGVGNLMGLLFPTLKETIVHIDNGYPSEALKAAHAWCNHYKSNYLFISVPKNSGRMYEKNVAGVRAFHDAIDKILDTGGGDYGIDHFFKTLRTKSQRDELITHIMANLNTRIEYICKSLNDTRGLCNDEVFKAFQLRLCLFGYKMATTPFTGGGEGEDRASLFVYAAMNGDCLDEVDISELINTPGLDTTKNLVAEKIHHVIRSEIDKKNIIMPDHPAILTRYQRALMEDSVNYDEMLRVYEEELESEKKRREEGEGGDSDGEESDGEKDGAAKAGPARGKKKHGGTTRRRKSRVRKTRRKYKPRKNYTFAH